MSKIKKIKVQNTEIAVSFQSEKNEFISLTDMTKNYGGSEIIKIWLRNRSTLEFLGVWERINNENFNWVEFDLIKNEAGTNTFTLSVKEWVRKTGAIGIHAKAGKYNSGTFAHKDIAFEFGSWLSPEFKLYLIKEFTRLKEEEARNKSLGWDLHRELVKTNLKIHNSSVSRNIIPPYLTGKERANVYASETDMLNHILFGKMAWQWKKDHVEDAKQGLNMRDFATIEQLIVLSNLESMNSQMLEDKIPREDRIEKLSKMAQTQMSVLIKNSDSKSLKSIKKMKMGEAETKEDFDNVMLNTRGEDHS